MLLVLKGYIYKKVYVVEERGLECGAASTNKDNDMISLVFWVLLIGGVVACEPRALFIVGLVMVVIILHKSMRRKAIRDELDNIL